MVVGYIWFEADRNGTDHPKAEDIQPEPFLSPTKHDHELTGVHTLGLQVVCALSDPRVFYDAVDDEEKFRTNLDRMMKTVERFLEMPATDVTAMSEYVYAR